MAQPQSDLLICNIDYDMQFSQRIGERNASHGNLQPVFDPRPVQTQYSDMPILDAYSSTSEPIQSAPVFNTERTFFAGNSQAPWSGFATNIDTESSLRSQFFALQTCEQSQFVPASGSDMYVPAKLAPPPGTETWAPVNRNTMGLAMDTFNNSTRTQRLNSNCKCD